MSNKYHPGTRVRVTTRGERVPADIGLQIGSEYTIAANGRLDGTQWLADGIHKVEIIAVAPDRQPSRVGQRVRCVVAGGHPGRPWHTTVGMERTVEAMSGRGAFMEDGWRYATSEFEVIAEPEAEAPEPEPGVFGIGDTVRCIRKDRHEHDDAPSGPDARPGDLVVVDERATAASFFWAVDGGLLWRRNFVLHKAAEVIAEPAPAAEPEPEPIPEPVDPVARAKAVRVAIAALNAAIGEARDAGVKVTPAIMGTRIVADIRVEF